MQELQQSGKDITITADFHLVLPVFINSAFTLGTAEKPAEMSGLEFPGRTDFLALAFLVVPAVFSFGCPCFALINQQEVDMSLNIQRYASPSLLIALDGF